jgi:hypothetical protein
MGANLDSDVKELKPVEGVWMHFELRAGCAASLLAEV